jgi:hypothetical protein
VSVYDWPDASVPGEDVDDPFARLGYQSRRRGPLAHEDALAAGRTLRAAAPAARAPAAPANTLLNMWLPLGPTGMLQGQAANRPRVSGRVRALAVHPGGDRIYAAAANGGIWYSSNGGGTWRSIGGLASTDIAGITRPAHRNACGAVLVRFDHDFPDDESKDLVFVGTGETTPRVQARPGSPLGGVGIFVAKGPAASTDADPWTIEAPNLQGEGVYRMAIQPGGDTVVAATSIGLVQRPASPAAHKNWDPVAGAPFSTLKDACTDVLWTAKDDAAGIPGFLWVWVVGEHFGLWVRFDGATDFLPVDVTGAYNQVSALAASEPPTRVYMLNNRHTDDATTSKLPALFRIDPSADPSPLAEEVTEGVPDVLTDQGDYDITIAVDPGNADRVAIAGSFIAAKNPEGDKYESYNGSIVVGEVGLKAGKLTYGHAAAPTMVGIGVHADVHDLRYSNGGARLWTGCDGGVFRSDHPTKQVGFYACNDGLSIAEANFVASHPTCEGWLAVGLQDNGVVERDSTSVWRVVQQGDGGGVAFDPTKPSRYVSQYVQATWHGSSGGGFESLLARAGTTIQEKYDNENSSSAFYSSPGAIKHTRPGGDVGQVILGTDRVWYTEDWGGHWVTLPTGTDPLTPSTYNRTQDQLGETVKVCRWASPDVAWILTGSRYIDVGGGQVFRFERASGSADAGGPGSWTSPPERILPQSTAQHGKAKKVTPTAFDAHIREASAWTDLAVNLEAGGAQRGTKGAVYLGTAGHPTKTEVDTLWWFDGTDTWYPTHLRSKVAAPVTAVLCDPAHPELVYVGTTVGVWRGTRVLADGQPPEWNWEDALVNGLPEAAVEDLSLFDSDGVRLLRAAIAARGVWELELDATVTERTYLRAHDDDQRRRQHALTVQRDGTSPRSWHGSPDVRPRRAPVAVPVPTTLPWFQFTPDIDPELLRRFQSALRSQKNDPRCRPTGVWDFYFEEVLRDNGAPVSGLAPVVSITAAFWNAVMVAPHATAEPWGATTPSEADLYEFAARLTEGDPDETSCVLPPVHLKLDVVVHRRSLAPLDGNDVRVTLLQWIDPKTTKRASSYNPSSWFTGNVPWTAAVNDVLNSADGTTSKTFADGWSFVGSGADVRKTLAGQTLDPMRSGVVTFDLDMTSARTSEVVLLVAVLRQGSNVALAPANLSDLALSNANVAVRSMRISADA